MTPSQLKHFKEEALKFYKLILLITNHWSSSPHFTTLTTLLQNLSFYAPECANWDMKKELDSISQIRKIIIEMAAYYPDCHITNWVKDEVNDLYIFSQFEPLDS